MLIAGFRVHYENKKKQNVSNFVQDLLTSRFGVWLVILANFGQRRLSLGTIKFCDILLSDHDIFSVPAIVAKC